MGCGFTSGGQESGSVFSTVVCKIQASDWYVESLPLVLNDKRSCFSQGERFAVRLSLDCALALRKQDAFKSDIWKPSIGVYIGMYVCIMFCRYIGSSWFQAAYETSSVTEDNRRCHQSDSWWVYLWIGNTLLTFGPLCVSLVPMLSPHVNCKWQKAGQGLGTTWGDQCDEHWFELSNALNESLVL